MCIRDSPGGMAALMKWIGKEIKYPSIAQEMNIEGRVIVQFVIGRDGSVRDVQVLRTVDPTLDKEAVRVVKAMRKSVSYTHLDVYKRQEEGCC